MGAHEFFPATTTNLFIQNVRDQALAYGWVIDYFGTYSGSNNRLHLHNAAGSHFELWYNSASAANIVGCTGYSSGAAPTAQPGVSGTGLVLANGSTDIIVTPQTIVIKCSSGTNKPKTMHFGTIIDKLGDWAGGTFFSSTSSTPSSTHYRFWQQVSGVPTYNQVLINGEWSTLSGVEGVSGIVHGVWAATGIQSKMPFAYSAGILPVPLLLVQTVPGHGSLKTPLGYAPDVMRFAGGSVYPPLSIVTIGGVEWLAFAELGLAGTYTNESDLLIRLATTPGG